VINVIWSEVGIVVHLDFGGWKGILVSEESVRLVENRKGFCGLEQVESGCMRSKRKIGGGTRQTLRQQTCDNEAFAEQGSSVHYRSDLEVVKTTRHTPERARRYM